MSNPNPPADVLEVSKAMRDSAVEAYGDDNAVQVYPEERAFPGHKPSGRWIVGCIYDGWGPSMLWCGGEWSYRYGYKADEPMPGGKEEALANAGIFFTG